MSSRKFTHERNIVGGGTKETILKASASESTSSDPYKGPSMPAADQKNLGGDGNASNVGKRIKYTHIHPGDLPSPLSSPVYFVAVIGVVAYFLTSYKLF